MYRYAKTRDGKRRLQGTTGLSQQMYGVNLYDGSKEHVMIAEGAWDAMALWEHMATCRWNDDRLVSTASSQNLLAQTNILGLPGCTTFFPKWGKLLAGKIVTVMFDNDHERIHPSTGKVIASGALMGMHNLIDKVAGTANQPKEIHYLRWGDEQDYWTKDLPHGYDVTNALRS
jgi:hypothetical protein